ncbi:hypothetical protein [Flavobacterium sp.]|uniref:hypothetical protein n=1 Tax=Flavobacterium sp. TaxID=239 RepID=UPI003919C139
MEKYYSGEGVIFDETAHYPWIEKDYVKPYSPKIKDIEKVEEFIAVNYYEYKQNILDSFKITKYRIDKKFKNPKNVLKKFHKYNRQYAGFINKANDTIIYVGVLNFADKKKAEKYFEHWKEMILLGNQGFYDKNQDYFNINISRKSFVYKLCTKK